MKKASHYITTYSAPLGQIVRQVFKRNVVPYTADARQVSNSFHLGYFVAAFAVLCGLSEATFAQSCPLLPLSGTEEIRISLGMVEDRLVNCNRDVLAAQRSIDAAEADRITAGQRPNPNLTVGASNINRAAGIGSGPLQDKTIDSSVRLDQLVERGGKATLRERQADAVVNAARADWHDVIRQQRLLLRQNYFELLFQQARVDTQREFAVYARASLEATEKRLKASDIAPSEANRFRLDGARAQNDLRQAEFDLRKARLELAKSIGAEVNAQFFAVLAVKLPSSNGAKIPSSLDDRADLAAATYRREAAEAGSALAASIATRDVTVSAQFDRWPASATNPQGTGNSFGLYLSIPLSIRHANEGEAKRALTDLQVAKDVLTRLKVQAKFEAKLNLESWQAAVDRASRVEGEILPLARNVAKAAEFAYGKGATSVLDLLDARRTLKQIELDASQANTDAGKTWAQWFASVELISGKAVEQMTSEKP